MTGTTPRQAVEREETLRLVSLGFFTVTDRMRITGLKIGATVTLFSFNGDDLELVAGEETYTVRPQSIDFRTTFIRVWIREGGARKCVMVLSATVDDRFVAEANPARIKAGLPLILTPEQKAAQRRQYEADLAQPLADKAVGKTVAEVRALDAMVTGYELVFTDGSSVIIRADIRDYDIPVALIDDQGLHG
jgi:hypothetical protein